MTQGWGPLPTQGGLDKLKELAPLVDTSEDKDSWLKELRRRIVKVPLGKAGGFFLEENVEQLYGYLAQHYAGRRSYLPPLVLAEEHLRCAS